MSESSEQPKPKTITRRDALVIMGNAVLSSVATTAVATPFGRRMVSSVLRSLEHHHKGGMRELPRFPEYEAPQSPQRVLVVPVQERGDADIDIEKIRENMDSVKIFFSENSYGKFQYDYDILPTRTVDLPEDRDQPYKVADIIDDSFSDDERKLGEGAKTRLYVLRPDSKPEYGGVMIDPKGYKRALVNAGSSPTVYGHELGHTLGLGHANELKASIPGDYTHNVQIDEYKAIGNMMGGITAHTTTSNGEFYYDATGTRFDVAQRVQLGWLGRGDVVDVSEDGEFTLSILEETDNKIKAKALRIKKSDTGDVYWVNFRPIGWGSAAPSVEIVKWDEKAGSPSYQIMWERRTASTEPQPFRDVINGITVKEVDHDTYVDQNDERVKGVVKIRVNFDK